VPGGGGGDDDPTADAGTNPGDPDAGPPPVQALNVNGAVSDYWNGVLGTVIPVEGASVSTEGIDPQITTTTGTAGAYVLDNVPVGSVFYTSLTAPANFRATRTEPITVVDQSLTQDLYMVSDADADRQFVSAGNIIPDPLTGAFIVDMYRNNGDPFVGLNPADLELLDALGQPVIAMGPYFFGLGGDMLTNADVPQSLLALGKARVGYLNVPPGTYTFRINYLDGQGLPALIDTMVTVSGPESFTLARTMNGGGGGGGANNGAYDFMSDVYPILMTGAEGGVGCKNCHRAGGLAALLPFDGTPANTHALVIADPTIVDLINPIDSLLLTKPLYEDPPNHPNATFASIDDPNYVIIMTWITQGAILDKNAL
jgi:hypothetical protein